MTMRTLPVPWIHRCILTQTNARFVTSTPFVRFSSSRSTSLSPVVPVPDKLKPALRLSFMRFTLSYEQASSFTSCPVLLKAKKSFKYDSNYVKQPKSRKKKGKKVDINSISWANETEGDLTKLTSAELEEQHEPMPDEETLLQAFTVETVNRTGVINKDAEVSLKELVKKYPKLKLLDGTDFVKYIEFMSMYGFHPEQAVHMILLHPPLFSNYSKQINESMLTWRSMGYTEKSIITMLQYYPQLVEQPSLETRTRFGFLSGFFSREETMFAILNCVNVLYDHETILRKKLEYLIKANCHTTKSIARSLTLSYPLRHMKIRHEFLIRAGLFQKENYYAQHKKLYMIHPRIPRNKYFPPADIVCTSDEEFLKICTDNTLSLNELVAFEELYEKELEREKLYASDDEEDEDTESESDTDDEEMEEAEYLLSPALGANNSSAFFSKKDSSDFYY